MWSFRFDSSRTLIKKKFWDDGMFTPLFSAQIQIHAERVFWLLLPEVNKMFPKNQFVAQDQQARHLSVCPQWPH